MQWTSNNPVSRFYNPALPKLPRIILLNRLLWFQDSESLGLELFDVLEQHPLVPLGIHFLVDFTEHT
jgi:hypothetical protein